MGDVGGLCTMKGVRAFAGLALAFCLAAPAAAQLPQAVLTDVAIRTPSGPVEPGDPVALEVRAVRVCPSAAFVMAEQEIALSVIPGDELVGRLHYPQQPCATGGRQPAEGMATVRVPGDAARGETVALVLRFTPSGHGPAEVGVDRTTDVAFTLSTPDPVAESVAEPPAREAPSPGVLAPLAVALLAALRRHGQPA
jgi:hypothetical protein